MKTLNDILNEGDGPYNVKEDITLWEEKIVKNKMIDVAAEIIKEIVNNPMVYLKNVTTKDIISGAYNKNKMNNLINELYGK